MVYLFHLFRVDAYGRIFQAQSRQVPGQKQADKLVFTRRFGSCLLRKQDALLKIRGGVILYLQILNQYVLLALLWFIVRCFCGIDGKLERLPAWIKKIFELLSKITLEIYVVQIGIITPLAKLLPFPLNWILLTSVILIGALILHFVSDKLVSGITLLFKKIKNKAKAD